MKLVNADIASLLHIFRNMREDDRREVFATRWDTDPDALAVEAITAWGPFAFVAWADGEPVAAIGATNVWPGVWSAWMIATDKFGHVGKHLTRWVRRVMIPAIREAGCHRVEARSAADHTVAHAWMEALGAKPEFVLRRYGRDKQDFILFAWEF